MTELSNFFQHLQLRQRQLALPDLFDEQRSRALILANAALRVAALRQSGHELPPQLAVIGPTQSGKSTLVNLLLGQERAIASPLAGFTRHAQGFVTAGSMTRVAPVIENALPGWRQGVPEEEERQGVFQLLPVDEGVGFCSRPALLWDTPDFDSVGSRGYRDTVPEICALSDALLLVVSREKYADRSVWQLLRLLAPLRRPMMICLNKVAPEESAALTAALRSRLEKERIAVAGIWVLPYITGGGGKLNATGEATDLRGAMGDFLVSSVEQATAEPPLRLLRLNWEAWSVPLRGELAALQMWRQAVRTALDESRADYQRDCLENPRYSYALQRAVVRLLELLEIPGIAAALSRVRSVLTWPARKLRGVLGSRLALAAKDQDQEQQILLAGVTHLLLELQRLAGEQLPLGSELNRLWWRRLLDLQLQRQEQLEAGARAAVASYLRGFDLEIENASQRLYRHLQQHPATLNGLRAARVTTDAAAVALALKTGGIGINDLLLTPALLAVTSLLAEGAVGGYMKQVEAELKIVQMGLLDTQLFNGPLLQSLDDLPAELAPECRLGISGEQLARIDVLLGENV
ncbi:MAG: 50S ribosome-binding GTPase [Gammaproteobacteria bacterium]|nr:50S ribosome-binding GTPase [Gammaproteobacteria bacterium]